LNRSLTGDDDGGIHSCLMSGPFTEVLLRRQFRPRFEI
jgi:hypothetical protein